MLRERHDGGEEIEFLRGQFGKAIEPKAAEIELRDGAQVSRRFVLHAVEVFEVVGLQPIEIGFEEQGEIVELGAKLSGLGNLGGECGELARGNLVALQFAQQEAEPRGETRQSRGGVKQFQVGALLIQQSAQHHDATFVVEPVHLGRDGFAQDELCEAIEGKDLQSRVTVEIGSGEQLAFELERGLFRGEQQERRTFGRRDQFTADLREAAVSLTAAGGAEQESRSHGLFFNRNRAMLQKNKVFNFGGWDGICPSD